MKCSGYEAFEFKGGLRRDREPAPILCEGSCRKVTMHVFSRTTTIREGDKLIIVGSHEVYKCRTCGQERVWG